MICHCIGNSLTDVPASELSSFNKRVHLDRVELVKGKEYMVYGVLFEEDRPWFLVCEDDNDEYPKPHFGGFFTFVDNRIPPDWSLCIDQGNAGSLALLPQLWADDPAFMEKLADGSPSAVAAFRQLKAPLSQWHAVNHG